MHTKRSTPHWPRLVIVFHNESHSYSSLDKQTLDEYYYAAPPAMPLRERNHAIL